MYMLHHDFEFCSVYQLSTNSLSPVAMTYLLSTNREANCIVFGKRSRFRFSELQSANCRPDMIASRRYDTTPLFFLFENCSVRTRIIILQLLHFVIIHPCVWFFFPQGATSSQRGRSAACFLVEWDYQPIIAFNGVYLYSQDNASNTGASVMVKKQG